MTPEPTLYAAVLRLSRRDILALRVTDAYSVHRVVYGLFTDPRSQAEKQASLPSGILYADKGGDVQHRRILLLADRLPNLTPPYGTVDCKAIPAQFLAHRKYAFAVTVNPTRRDGLSGKLVGVRGREAIAGWFTERAEQSWGFRVDRRQLQVGEIQVQRFNKGDRRVTHGSATVHGALEVVDQPGFQHSFRRGIGRGRAFGFGLLQIVPLNTSQESS
jgi:CRISPR system Cascade subunit CasE